MDNEDMGLFCILGALLGGALGYYSGKNQHEIDAKEKERDRTIEMLKEELQNLRRRNNSI